MSHYSYQYKQQWYLPSGMAGSLQQCPKPCVVTCTPGPKPCTARSIVQSSPCIASSCREATSALSSPIADTCGTRCPVPCGLQGPQLHGQGWEQLGVPQCATWPCPSACAGGCTTASAGQHCSYPYSYQWSKSYTYGSGPC